MTRDDLVNYITTKAQMLEADDVAACQSFVSKRYELIYNSYLWKDALTMVDMSIDPINNPDNAVGIVSLPSQVERVVAMRTSTQAVKIHALEEYYRIDWNRFADISDINGLVEFAILNPIWFTCRPNSGFSTQVSTAGATYYGATPGTVSVTVTQGQRYVIVPGASEAGASLVNGNQTIVLANGVPVAITAQSNVINFTLPGNLIPSGSKYGFTASFAPALTGGSSYWIVWGPNESSLDNFGGTPDGNIASTGIGSATHFAFTVVPGQNLHGKNPVTAVTAAIYPDVGPPSSAFTAKIFLVSLSQFQTSGNGCFVSIASDNPLDNVGGANVAQIKVTWRDTQNRYTKTGTMPMVLTPTDGSGFIEVESIFKPTTQGNVVATLTNPVQGYTFTNVVGTMLPTDTRSPGLQRVRLLSAPNQTLTLSVLGKKPFVPLDFGSEVPLIRNLDNCLIAFGLADMLQRGRQYGKAGQQMQEATALLTELAKLETLQAANNQRFVPDAGYGDPFFAPSSNRGLWT